MQDFDSNYAFIQDPNAWPNWPVLPVKKYVEEEGGHTQMLTGVIIAAWDRVQPIVYLANMYSFSFDKLEEYEKAEYENIRNVVEDGWRVD